MDRYSSQAIKVRVVIAFLIVVGILLAIIVALVRCSASPASTSAVTAADTAATSQQQSAAATSSLDTANAASAASSSATNANYLGVDDPWLPEGRFTTGDRDLDAKVKTFCDEYTDSALDAGDNAYNVYLHVSWMNYVERDDNQYPWGNGWKQKYAKQLIDENGGNCYEFCAFIQFVMQYFGYTDADAEPCLVLLQSGNWGTHGLVFVTSLDGNECLIDASLSSNGWLLPRDSYTYQLDTTPHDPT